MSMRRDLDRLAARVDQMDQHGTRGVTAIQVQITDLVKDLAELKGETRAWQEAHSAAHAQEARDRVMGRRWLIGTGIAGIVAMATAVGLLIDIAAHVHG